MNRDLNQCNFIGRLGRDPDIRYNPNGKAMTTISIACGDDYKDKNSGEKVERTNWVRVVAFGRLAEIIGEYCHKGSRIFVSGKQVTRQWKDKEENDRYTTEIIANEMQMLDSKGGNQQSEQQNAAQSGEQQNAPQGGDDFDDKIPF